MARARWYDPWVAMFEDECAALDLLVSPESVISLLEDRVAKVATAMRVTPATARGYLREEDVRDMARECAFLLAAEQPGADLAEVPRTTTLDQHGLAFAMTCVGMAGRIHNTNGDSPACEQCLALLVNLGAFLAEGEGSAGTAVPPAWLHRAARQVENAAQVLNKGGSSPDGDVNDEMRTRLIVRLIEDADLLRKCT